jgi:hypothetical protein
MHDSRITRTTLALLLSGVFSVSALPASAQTAPDKYQVNEQDRAKGAVTADQQKENASDRDVVKRIRESLVKDKSLSTYAHNVKVVHSTDR